MQTDVERFLHILETERGFSVNTIFAYRNDLTQFLAFIRGENGEEAVRESAETPDRQDMTAAPNQMLNVLQWNQLTDDELGYLRELLEELVPLVQGQMGTTAGKERSSVSDRDRLS